MWKGYEMDTHLSITFLLTDVCVIIVKTEARNRGERRSNSNLRLIEGGWSGGGGMRGGIVRVG